MNTQLSHPIRRTLCAALLFFLASASFLVPFVPAQAQAATPPDSRVSVVIELDAPAAAQIYAELLDEWATSAQAAVTDAGLAAQLAAATQAQLSVNQAAQEALLRPLADLDAQVIYRTQRVYNGVAVRVAPDQIADILALPGVAAVHPLIAKRPSNARSVPFIGAPALWQGSGVPATGAGIRMAIIDTGVDYLHTAFGGPGTGYKENDVTKIGDSPYFPSYKIVGGYDFSGDKYNADPEDADYQPIGAPDPDPMDCYGHGTHVAATAAGFGVTTSGQTYPGPYTGELNASAFLIGPGVAPQADIYALKVFGCTGSSEIVDLAIEWAVDPNGDGDFADRMDVINMSLGSTYGGLYDATSIAADRAAQAGVIVVASAGNSGDTYYAVGSPGNATQVISVAATRSALVNDAPLADSSLVDTTATFSSRGPRRIGSLIKPDLGAPGYQITSARSGTGNSGATLNGTSMAAPHVAGAMALLRQLHPTWSPAELKALIMNTAMPAVRSAAPYTATFDAPGRAGAGRIDLRSAAAANTLLYNADEPGAVGVSFGAQEVVGVASATRNVRLVNKSAAPASYTLTYAPRTDIPGVEFVLPANNFMNLPAGGVATFSVTMNAVASQMQHTRDPAVPDVQGFPRHWLSEESGLLMLWPAGAPFAAQLRGATALPPNPSGATGEVAFNYNPLAKELSYTLSVENMAAGAITGAAILRGLPGAPALAGAYSLYQGGGALAPGAPVQGVVILSAHDEMLLAAGYLHVTIFTTSFPSGELRGQVNPLRPILKTPIHAAPRPAATMQAATAPLDFGATAQATRDLELTGQHLSGANFPIGYLSLVSALELHMRSPNTPPLGVLRPEPDIYDHADIKFVGAANDLRTTGVMNQTMVSFGLVTYADWASPREVELSIFVDTDEDGVYDYRLYNSDLSGYNNRFRTSDAFITAVENLKTKQKSSQEFLNGLSAQAFDTALFNNNVMLLPVRASALGLTNSNTDFVYYVETKSSETIGVVDRTPPRRYDLAHVGLDTSGSRLGAPVYDDVDGAVIPVGFNLANLEADGGDALLLLHHHNVTGQRAEVVSVVYTPPGLIYLPLVWR